MVSISLNDAKLLALVINYDLTLDKLRIEIEKRTPTIKKEDLFLNIDGFPITSYDEEKILIRTIIDIDNGNRITIQSVKEPSTVSSFPRETSSVSYEVMVTTTSTSFTNDHQGQPSKSDQLNPIQWKKIYHNNNLLRGRRFLSNGPEVADYPAIKLKSNWQPNSYFYDNTTMQFETCCQQMNDESAAYKMYKIETIVKLPFVHLTFGNDSSKCRSSRTNTESSSTSVHFIIPRFVHIFDPDMIELDPKFINEVDSIFNESSNENKYGKLTNLFDKYGHGYAVKVVLGGEKLAIGRQQIDESADQHERQRQVKANTEATCDKVDVGISVELNKTRANIHQILSNNSYENHLTMGGDALTSDTNAWSEALNNFETWRIIKYEQVEPLYKLLDLERQQTIKAIIDEYQQEQERQKQQSCRCRNVPTELIFHEHEGVFRLKVRHEHQHKIIRRLSFPEPITILLFFYSPSGDEWYLKYEKQNNNLWISLKRVQIDSNKLKLADNIIQTLRKTNPMPKNEIIKICQFYDNIYINALTKFGEAICNIATPTTSEIYVKKIDSFEPPRSCRTNEHIKQIRHCRDGTHLGMILTDGDPTTAEPSFSKSRFELRRWIVLLPKRNLERLQTVELGVVYPSWLQPVSSMEFLISLFGEDNRKEVYLMDRHGRIADRISLECDYDERGIRTAFINNDKCFVTKVGENLRFYYLK